MHIKILVVFLILTLLLCGCDAAQKSDNKSDSTSEPTSNVKPTDADGNDIDFTFPLDFQGGETPVDEFEDDGKPPVPVNP